MAPFRLIFIFYKLVYFAFNESSSCMHLENLRYYRKLTKTIFTFTVFCNSHISNSPDVAFLSSVKRSLVNTHSRLLVQGLGISCLTAGIRCAPTVASFKSKLKTFL